LSFGDCSGYPVVGERVGAPDEDVRAEFPQDDVDAEVMAAAWDCPLSAESLVITRGRIRMDADLQDRRPSDRLGSPGRRVRSGSEEAIARGSVLALGGNPAADRLASARD
jgi:hypothetical protein